MNRHCPNIRIFLVHSHLPQPEKSTLDFIVNLYHNSVLTMMTEDASRLKVLRRLEARLSTNQIRSVLRHRFSFNFLACKGYGGMGVCHKHMVVLT